MFSNPSQVMVTKSVGNRIQSLCSLLGGVLFGLALVGQELISFDDRSKLASRRPILIAHRGGVITPSSPECSLTAIRLARKHGYDMVELDIQQSRDGVPIVFHDRTLQKACGRPESVADLNATELTSIPYLKGTDSIATFEQALRVCRETHLGVMLDLKSGRNEVSFLQRIDQLILGMGFKQAAISFSGSEAARQHLTTVRFTPTNDEMKQLRSGAQLDLSQRFWFGLPSQISASDIQQLKQAKALILPAINTFRYPKAQHYELAKKDIQHLLSEGVDGFQIDSIYQDLFNAPRN